jgi:agmatinase
MLDHRPGPGPAVLGLPFDCGVHTFRGGAHSGPDAVCLQSPLVRRFNQTHADFDPVASLGVVDCGNVKLTPSRILDAFERIEQASSRIVEAGAVPITIGSDSSVTVPVMRAVANHHKDLVVLHVYSHTNANAYDPADKYNAATQFAHVAAQCLVPVACRYSRTPTPALSRKIRLWRNWGSSSPAEWERRPEDGAYTHVPGS